MHVSRDEWEPMGHRRVRTIVTVATNMGLVVS